MTLYDPQSGVVLDTRHEQAVAEFVRVEEGQLDLDVIWANLVYLRELIRERRAVQVPPCR